MDKIELDNVTIVTVNCNAPEEGIKALRYSMKDIKFGLSILFSSGEHSMPDIESVKIPEIDSIHKYNDFMLKLIDFIDTPYVLVVQSDGFVVNAGMWNDVFLDYDYIGAPWPSNQEWIKDQAEHKRDVVSEAVSKNRIGNGGFSLRSRRFLEYSNKFETCEGWGEDLFLCGINYNKAIDSGIKFPPHDIAYQFSYENRCEEFGDNYRDPFLFDVNKHFGFHHCNFTNGKEILNLKNDR